MGKDFDNCLKKHRIGTSSVSRNLINKELLAAMGDLKEAGKSFKNKAYKWSTIQSYYAMFHAARALLYNKGYKERSHYCLAVAIEELYAKNKEVSMKHIRAFLNAMNLREDADYSEEYSKEGAKEALSKAKDFLKATKAILK